MTQKILRLDEFQQLTEELQLNLLHKDGVYVGKRKSAEKTVILFQLYSFYVEVYYKKYRKEIDNMITSAETEILQPYLDQIDVRGLRGNKRRK